MTVPHRTSKQRQALPESTVSMFPIGFGPFRVELSGGINHHSDYTSSNMVSNDATRIKGLKPAGPHSGATGWTLPLSRGVRNPHTRTKQTTQVKSTEAKAKQTRQK